MHFGSPNSTSSTLNPLESARRQVLHDDLHVGRMGGHRGVAIAGVVYFVLSLCLWSRVWITGNPTNLMTCACSDPAQQLWWLEWLPQALLHGHNPFYSDALFSRFGGISAMSNTSWMLPALALSPVTLLFGPIASSNLAALVAPVISGLAAYLLAARFVQNYWARTVAGAFFAFSPFIVATEVFGHLNFTLVAYIPLALLVGDRLIHSEIQPLRAGILLGILTTAEFFVGVEVIVFTVVLAGALSVAAFLVQRSAFVASLRRLLVASATGVGICVITLAYPIWVALFGRAHVMGPYWSDSHSETPYWLDALQHLGAMVIPGTHVFSSSLIMADTGYGGPRGPGMEYVGFGIVLVLVLCVPIVRRPRLYAILAAAAAFCILLESVSRGLWESIPIVGSATPARFALVVALLLGLMLALVVDGFACPERAWARRLCSRFGRRAGYLLAVTVILVAVGPIAATYSPPFVVQSSTIPTWFKDASSVAISGRPILILPFGRDRGRSMAWEAETGIHSELVSAYGFILGQKDSVDEYRSPLLTGKYLRQISTSRSTFTFSQTRRVTQIFERWSPLEVVLIVSQIPIAARDSLRQILGPPTISKNGADIWLINSARSLWSLSDLRLEHPLTQY
jgi:hypothetical protein